MTSQKTNDAKRGTWDARSLTLWALPVIGVFVAIVFVFRAMPNSSANIRLLTDSADGVNAGNTLVFHRGVPVGRVSDVSLNDDLSQVVLELTFSEGNAAFARAGAEFWMIRPELESTGLQGLRTIVSGPEIHAQPGTGEPITQAELMQPPVISGISEADLDIRLITTNRGALTRGSRVTYRDISTGAVTDVELLPDGRNVQVTVRILARFRHLVRANTVFWKEGGFNFNFGLLTGADVEINSLSSLFSGEVAFATPDPPGPRVSNNAEFAIAEEARDSWLEWQPALATEDESVSQPMPEASLLPNSERDVEDSQVEDPESTQQVRED